MRYGATHNASPAADGTPHICRLAAGSASIVAVSSGHFAGLLPCSRRATDGVSCSFLYVGLWSGDEPRHKAGLVMHQVMRVNALRDLCAISSAVYDH